MGKPSVLTLSHISYSYPDAATAALSDVSASFARGWTGIVGENGCGKSTLARIACGIIEPDEGSITPRLTYAFCPQDASVAPDALFDFACDFAPEAMRLRRALSIEDDMPWRFDELSCGEQKKIQVATALWSNPELLVVDEPTNHVDAACRDELRCALARYRGIGLLISHDRTLLDALATRTLGFEGGRAVMRPGTYSQARKQAEIERESAVREQSKARAEERRLKAEYIKRAEAASKSAARRSARRLDKHDSDGRERRRLAVFTGQDGKAGKLAARMAKRVERAHDTAQMTYVGTRYEGGLWLDAKPCPRTTIARMGPYTLPCGDGRTLEMPELLLGNTDRLGIVGPNGAGKSTLVRHLMTLLAQQTERGLGVRTLFMPQEIVAAEARRLLAEVRAMPDAKRRRLLSIVARLGSRPDRILEGDAASPGELHKLMIARGILDSPELIVADEPTNHLDVRSIEALEQALANFPGALVLVSHDEAFLSATVDARLVLEPGPDTTTCRIA